MSNKKNAEPYAEFDSDVVEQLEKYYSNHDFTNNILSFDDRNTSNCVMTFLIPFHTKISKFSKCAKKEKRKKILLKNSDSKPTVPLPSTCKPCGRSLRNT